MKLFILNLLFLSTLTACSSLLYYPTRVYHVNPKKIPTPPEEINFINEKNNKKVAWYFSSPKQSDTLLLIFHGNGQNISAHFANFYWVLEHNYDFFIFDYPGYGGSYGKPTPENTVETGKQALSYVRKRWPNKKIIIVGQSLGGAVAMRTLIETKDRQSICAAFIESSFDSYQKVGQKIMAKYWLTWPFQWLPFLVFSDEHAPYKEIDKISPTPLLLMHREDDGVVPSLFSKRILAQAKQPKTHYSLPGPGNIDAFTGVAKKDNQEIFLNFIKKHCSE